MANASLPADKVPLGVEDASASYQVAAASSPQVPPGYKQTEVGMIPDDWVIKELGELCDYQNGTSLEHLFNTRHGFQVISIGNYSGDGSYVHRDTYIDHSHRKLVEKFVLSRNDLAMSLNDKTSIGTILGRVLLIDEDNRFVFNQRTMRLRPKLGIIPAYFHHVINGDDIHNSLVGLAKPGTQIYVNTDDVIGLKIPVPEVSEQRAIAAALSDVDALIGGLDRLIAKKRDLKQAAMQQLLTGQTRLPGFCAGTRLSGDAMDGEEPISGKWDVKQVAELGEVVTGGTPPTEIKEFWGDGYPWITPTDISSLRDMFSSERSLTRKGLNAIRVLPANTVLVTCIASVGKNAILKSEGGCNQQINALIPNNNNSAEFLYYLFEASKQYLLANAGTTATSIISKATFKEMIFTVPSHAEQTAIATILSDMDAEITALEARRDKTRALKQGMMQELLTGRIRLV